jgi:hypothetical protein
MLFTYVSLTTVAIDEGTCEGMSVFPSFARLRSIRRTCYYNKNKNNLVTQGFMWVRSVRVKAHLFPC